MIGSSPGPSVGVRACPKACLSVDNTRGVASIGAAGDFTDESKYACFPKQEEYLATAKPERVRQVRARRPAPFTRGLRPRPAGPVSAISADRRGLADDPTAARSPPTRSGLPQRQGQSVADAPTARAHLPQRPLEQAEYREQRDEPRTSSATHTMISSRSVVSSGVAAADLVLDFSVPFADDTLGIGLHHVIIGPWRRALQIRLNNPLAFSTACRSLFGFLLRQRRVS